MSTVATDRRHGVDTGAAFKVPCHLATTANITLSAHQTIDGVLTTENMRVLVHQQTNQVANGIYAASSGTWIRTLDFDGVFDVRCGTQVFVTHGTNYARRTFYVTSADVSAAHGPIPDTDSIAFAEVSSGVPLIPQGSNTSVFVAARGKTIQLTTGITVDVGIMSADDTVGLQNATTGAVTITQGVGFTLRFAGTGTTGNRSASQRAELTIHFVSASEGYIFGAGLS